MLGKVEGSLSGGAYFGPLQSCDTDPPHVHEDGCPSVPEVTHSHFPLRTHDTGDDTLLETEKVSTKRGRVSLCSVARGTCYLEG
jgi:hypothetical protein